MRAVSTTMATFGLLVAGCLKPPPPVAAAAPVPLPFAVVLVSYAPGVAPTDAPERVTTAVQAELARHNLVPAPVDVDEALAGAATAHGRLEKLEASGGPVLLVECAPRFSAQVGGRYRWTVEVTATLADPADLDRGAEERAFSVPVHLLYDHEREPEAVTQAAPLVVREIGRLVDSWLAERAGSP